MEPFKNFKNYIFTSATTVSGNQSKGADNFKVDAASKNLKSNIENLEPNLQLNESNSSSVNAGERKKKFLLFNTNNNKLILSQPKQHKTNLRFQTSMSESDLTSSTNITTTTPTTTTNKKNSRKSYNILSPKKASIDNATSGMLLFNTLDKNLNELIEHFKLDLTSLESQSIENQNPLGNRQDSDSAEGQFYMISPQFLDTTDTSSNTYHKLALYSSQVLKKCIDHYKVLNENAAQFDISEEVKFNGYRSLLAAFENCCRRLLFVVKQLNDTKSSFLFQLKLNTTLPGAINIKDFQTWVRLMEKIEIVLQVACDIQEKQLKDFKEHGSAHDGPTLFHEMISDSDSSIETNLLCLGSVYQDSFFGRTCGFQFCESLRKPLTGCAVALASYNDGYELYSQNSAANVTSSSVNTPSSSLDQQLPESPATGTFIQGQATLFKSLVSGTKYMMDPELRAKKISKVMKDANVEFCKAFWQLTETDIVQMGSNMITPNVGVNALQKIPLSAPLTLPKRQNLKDDINNEFITVNPPESSNSKDTVQIRILSHELRDGMQNLDELKPTDSGALFNNILSFQTTPSNTPKSPNLIFHIHGGGFIAHSSKSHEIYLKPWCKELKIPIVSVDYSLAPEHVFPRASEECFYVYSWCLLNKNMLGWTGEKIILVGDSAGGSLVTNVVQRAITSNIRIPDALIPIYTPFLSTYSISPSRLMSVMDPLLNLGILWRCLAAYSGIDFKKETEKFKSILNLPESENKKQAVDNQAAMRSSPTMASIIKTTPFKAFLSRSSTQGTLTSSKSKSPPSSPTSTTPPSSNFNIRYSKRESLDFNSVARDSSVTEELVNIEVTQQEALIKDSLPIENKKEKVEDILSSKQKQRLLQLHKMLGDSVFLIERLRNHPLGRNPYMSPLLAEDEILAQFPKTYLITTDQDPLLDDSIAMRNKLRQMNVECNLDVLEGLHHGFLNFTKNSKDCLNGSKFVLNSIRTQLGGDRVPID